MRSHRRSALACAQLVGYLVAVSTVPGTADAQGDGAVLGLYHFVRGTADAERAFAFYHDVLGVELARSPFAGVPSAGAPPPRIASRAEAGSDPLVWNLTDTKGARFRTVFVHAPNTPFGLELSEFLDIPRVERPPNPWDPGASIIEFAVRDVDAALSAAKAHGAPVVTTGEVPVSAREGRAVLVRDPDGSLLELVQASPAAIAAAEPGQIVATRIEITVARAPTALNFYRDLLRLEVEAPRPVAGSDLRVYGVDRGALTRTPVVIPGARASLMLLEFSMPSSAAPPEPFHWKIQDVGSPQLQLHVGRLDELMQRTRFAGYGFLSIGAKPIERPFGRFVFAIGPDAELVEFVEPR